jgi:DUF4097 and DUF4098 domain-containing protein YvlB
MTTYDFDTTGPVELAVELGKGRLTIDTTEGNHAHVEISGRDADRVRVEQRGDRIAIVDPGARSAFTFTHPGFDIQVVVPAASGLAVKTGSAEVTATGTVGATTVRTGSGRVALDRVAGTADVTSGSGDVTIAAVERALRIKSGSGDVTVGAAGQSVVASSGSGNVAVRSAHGPVSMKSGSGDLRIAEADDDLNLMTASGDLEVGRVRRGRVVSKGASGDIRIGVPAGTPVWTDIATGSGRIRSALRSVGQPQHGQDHVELRARTGSGDVTLVEV